MNSLLKDRTSSRSWWDLKFWVCSLQGTFLLKSSPILELELRTTMATSACVVVYIVSFQRTWEKPSHSPCRLDCMTLCYTPVGFKPSQLDVMGVSCLLLVGSCHTVMAGLILCHCLCHLPAC